MLLHKRDFHRNIHESDESECEQQEETYEI